jgi:undecaprenyl-diphosphatase
MVSIQEAVVLAIVQGLTEWLPISSSGHLVILQQLLGIKASVAFDVMLHFGTLLAVVWFLRDDILRIVKAVLTFDFSKSEARLGAYIIIGTLPIAVAGLLFKSFAESLFFNLTAVGIALFINGIFLYLTRFVRIRESLNWFNALLVGIAQAVSIIPGISRSGSTISAAMLSGVDRKTAYKFSFLLSVLAILGASLIKFGDIDFTQEPLEAIAVGVIISAVVGYITLKIVAKSVVSGNFHKFAYYCWLVGLAIFVLTI